MRLLDFWLWGATSWPRGQDDQRGERAPSGLAGVPVPRQGPSKNQNVKHEEISTGVSSKTPTGTYQREREKGGVCGGSRFSGFNQTLLGGVLQLLGEYGSKCKGLNQVRQGVY